MPFGLYVCVTAARSIKNPAMMMTDIRITLEMYFLRLVMGFLPKLFGVLLGYGYFVLEKRGRRQWKFLKITFYSISYAFLKQDRLWAASSGKPGSCRPTQNGFPTV